MQLSRRPLNLLFAFLVGSFLVIATVILARKGVSQGEISSLLDRIYFYGEEHIWELSALSSLATGIWFSIARRRVVLSVLCLILSFLFSFVLPNFLRG